MNEKSEIVKTNGNTLDVFGTGFEQAQRICKALAASCVVPPMYQGSIPNCLIALDVANRIGIGVLAVMQKMYIVHGKPGFEATFVASAVNACGRYTPLRAKCNDLAGDDYGFYAVATEKSTGELLIGTTIDWKMVKKEGWNKKDGSKWLTMPEQMFKYRAMSFWQREYDPGLTSGVGTTDEYEDTIESDPAEVLPQTLDTVIASNEKKTSISPPPNKAQQDIAEAKKKDENTDLRKEVAEMANELWGDKGMIKLSELFRQDGTSWSTANFENLNKMHSELGDRLVVKADELSEKEE